MPFAFFPRSKIDQHVDSQEKKKFKSKAGGQIILKQAFGERCAF